ncbi:MAG: hypothetical protein COB53_08990 [Elusimicrobia bacterium]|nr:MAG: hypothetical protein COB53_08990 [Elusimicrobiota bacterium]
MRSLVVLWLIAASAVPAFAGRAVIGRSVKPVVSPMGYAGAALLITPASLKLGAPGLAPVGVTLGLPVLQELAVPRLEAPPAAAFFKKALISPRAHASRFSLNAADEESSPKETAGDRLIKTVADQARAAGKIAEKQKEQFHLDAFSAVFDGGMRREPTPVRTDEARRGIAAKTHPERGYLKESEGLKEETLLLKLREITGRGYRSHSYKESRRELFSNLDNFKYNGKRGVMAAYSQVFVPGTSGNGSSYRVRGDPDGDGHSNKDGMNTEHLWPQSYFNSRSPMVSDVHHLMATFVRPNAERSRYPFGEVPDHEAVYRNKAGAKLGRNEFEPPKHVKGLVARRMLYFYMRYGNLNILPGRQARNFWNSRIEMYIRWHEQYPPSVFEQRRNDLAEKWQGNRNPFVDDPGLVRRIGAEAFAIPTGRGDAVAGRGRPQESILVTSSRPGKKRHKKSKKKRGHRKKRWKHGR